MPQDLVDRDRKEVRPGGRRRLRDGIRLPARLARRLVSAAVLCICCLILGQLFNLIWQELNPADEDEGSADQSEWERLAPEVVLSRKTGHSVLFHRLPIQLMEPRPDIPYQYIYSDSAIELGHVSVVDILANLSESLKAQEYFSAYYKLQEAIANHVSPNDVEGLYNLDRYKFLPLIGDMYRRHPDAKWFVSVDGDSYVFWSTLLRFLTHYDPEDHWFFGQADSHDMWGANNTIWANGGAGYVLSKGVMDLTYAKDPWGFENQWDGVIASTPGGDVLLAQAMYRSPGIRLNNTLSGGAPMFTSEIAGLLSYTKANWYAPLITLHHLKPWETHDLRKFEVDRLAALGDDGIRYCDAANGLAPAFLQKALDAYESSPETAPVTVTMDAWTFYSDNFSYRDPEEAKRWDRPYDEHLCEALCDYEEDCLAWQFVLEEPEDAEAEGAESELVCLLSPGEWRFGVPDPKGISGWRVDRLLQFKRELDCDDMDARKLADLTRFA